MDSSGLALADDVHVIEGLLRPDAGSSCRRDSEGARRSSRRPRWSVPGTKEGPFAPVIPTMMPRGKRDPILLSHAELPVTDGEGPHGGGEGRRSTSEEESHLPRDDLTKSMSSSSVSSYHSALCSEGTETFKDCLEFLDEEGTPPREAGHWGGRADGAAPGRWALAGAPSVPPPPAPLARPQQAQLSISAKNSSAPGQGGRMGPLSRNQQPVTAAATGGELALPRQPGGMLGGAPSDSDEADSEVRALTARAFRSLSGLPGAQLDMCSSHTSSSLSNSLSEDCGRPRRWPVAVSEPRGTVGALHSRADWPFPVGVDGELLGLLGKEQFECVDVELESGEARKGHCKKRTVPKRQILLKRKERKEMGFGPRGDSLVPQPLPPTRKEPLSKGRGIGEDFRFNYKQFVKTASLDADASKTRAASCLVKNVLAKKMQYEQMIKMEQKGLQGSSTSSGLSSIGTDLLGDGLEGKSSSLSRSDCSFSAEDLRDSRVPVATVTAGDATTTHPAKGVVLSEATRENVCKLKKTFNELNERMKYQEVLEGHQLPVTTEEPASERTRYWRARALFETQSGMGKVLDVAPRFERGPKPWPSLKQRAIPSGHPHAPRFEAENRALPAVPPRRLFTSRAQEVRLVPQSQQEEKPLPVPRQPPSPSAPARWSLQATRPEPKEKVRIPQPRDVRKLVKSSYRLCFGTAGATRGTTAPASSGEPPPATPLVIHCTSVRRREPAAEPGDEEVLAAAGKEPAPACAEGSAKLTGSRPSPTHSSPVHITRVQATRREVAATEGPPASPSRRERSELRVPPRAAVAEGVPHVETHLNVLVGPRSPVAGAGEGSSAQSSTMLRTEKTLVLPPPSSTERKEGRSHGSTGGLHAAEESESRGQQHSSSDSRDPQAVSPVGGSTHPQPVKLAARSAPESPASERCQEQAGSQTVSAGSGGPAGGTGPAVPFQAGEDGKGASGWLPEQSKAWEHLPKRPVATEPNPPPDLADTTNYLAIPVKASKSSPMPKLPSVSSPASASFETPLVPNPTSASFGTSAAPNSASTSFGTPMVHNVGSASYGTPAAPSPASASFGTHMVPNMTNSSFGYPSASSLASTSFRTPSVSNPINKSFGTPLMPYPSSASFGIPLVPSPSSASFGTPLVPNPSSASFQTPSVPNLANSSLGIPPSRSSFGSSLVTNPVPASLGHPSVSNVSSLPFGSPLVPNLVSAPLGTGLCPQPSGEAPWSKPSAEPPLAQPLEGLAAVEHPVPLPPAQSQPHLEDTPHFLRRTYSASASSKSMPSPTKPFAPHLPAHRRMLVDPDSGKCYYMEPPRQPQLKTLYDPETGQYMEVLIPPVASHTGLYQAPFNPLLMTSGVYGSPYVPYSGFTGLPAPPPPSAPSPAHPDLTAAENPSISGTFSSAPKSEGPPATGVPDCGYLESLYYIPTGMGGSPGPSSGQPPAHTSPAAPEKGPMLQM